MTILAPVAFSDIEKMARAFAASKLFGINTPEQAIALMLIAQAEGLHPAVAARDYSIIQGKPALKADAMLARFQNAGGKVSWIEYTKDSVIGEFSHPSAPTPVRINWTFQMAQEAGLVTKAVWKQYPRAMLRARVISEGVRTVFPGVAVGVYVEEEVEAFSSEKKVIEVENDQQKISAPSSVLLTNVSSGPHANSVVSEALSESYEDKIQSKLEARKKAAFDALKNSRWPRSDLQQFTQIKFNKTSSIELSLDELEELVIAQKNYENAEQALMM